jgi:hypothetical protein
MPDDLGISSMHLSGKLFQMIDNKNKIMIVLMKGHDFFSYTLSVLFFLHYPVCILVKKYAKNEMR